jgi:hypothetical protein
MDYLVQQMLQIKLSYSSHMNVARMSLGFELPLYQHSSIDYSVLKLLIATPNCKSRVT